MFISSHTSYYIFTVPCFHFFSVGETTPLSSPSCVVVSDVCCSCVWCWLNCSCVFVVVVVSDVWCSCVWCCWLKYKMRCAESTVSYILTEVMLQLSESPAVRIQQVHRMLKSVEVASDDSLRCVCNRKDQFVHHFMWMLLVGVLFTILFAIYL